MNKSIAELFETLVKNTETRKIDFKREQYSLDNEHLKSKLIKDILCVANASGDDGYIVLGVKAEKGKPREITGVINQHDGADLAGIVNGVVDAPIHFEYLPLTYKGKECAVIHIPSSTGRPHWPKKDFGILKKHVFCTRRASGNVEASIPEIRQMCMETITISGIAKQKAKVSHHVVDELATLNMAERKAELYRILKSVILKIGLKNYHSMVSPFSKKETQFVLVSSYSDKAKREYSVFMYPWSVKGHDIIWSRNKTKYFIYPPYKFSRQEKERLKISTLIHVAYKNIYTSALETWHYDGRLRFSNEMKEPWGKVMKWEEDSGTNEKYEFFLPNVSSKEELKDRLGHMFEWIEKNL